MPKGLPNLSDTVGSATSNRIQSLGSQITDTINPRRVTSRSVDALKGQLFSELPELGSLTSSVSSFISDIVNDMKAIGDDSETENNIKQIKDEAKTQTSIFDSLVDWMKQIDSNLHGSPPYLLTIRDELSEMNMEVKALTQITTAASNLSAEQLDITRQMLRFDKDQDKKSRFKQQKDTSKITNKEQLTIQNDKKKDRKGLLAFLGGSFLGRLLMGLSGIIEPLLLALGGAKAVGAIRRLPFLKAPEIGKDGLPMPKRDAKGRFKARSKFSKLLSKTGSAAKKTAPAFAKVGKGAKAVLRGSGVLTLAILAMDALVGGFKDGIKSFREGNTAPKIIADFMFGALKGIVNGFKETIKLVFIELPKFVGSIGIELFKNFATFMDENVTQPASAKLKDIFMSIGDTFSKAFTFIKDKVSQSFDFMKSSIISGVKKLLNAIVDKTHTRRLLPESAQNFLSTPEPVPAVGGELTARSKSAETAAVMLTGQRTISDFNLEQMIGNTQQQAHNNIMSTPITTNVQNNNVFSGNIHTRNPDSPLFLRNNTSF